MSRLNLYWYLALAAPALIMFFAAYWRRKSMFWIGVCASVLVTHALCKEAAQTEAQFLFESIRNVDDAKEILKRPIPWVELGPVQAIASTALWGLLAWYGWPRIRNAHASKA